LILPLASGGRAGILEIVVVEGEGRFAVDELRRSRADAERMPEHVGLGLDHRHLARPIDDLDGALHGSGLARDVGKVFARDWPVGDGGETRLDHDVGVGKHEERTRLLRVGDPAILLAIGHQGPPNELQGRLGEAGRRTAADGRQHHKQPSERPHSSLRQMPRRRNKRAASAIMRTVYTRAAMRLRSALRQAPAIAPSTTRSR
jgi:hypothetical protein